MGTGEDSWPLGPDSSSVVNPIRSGVSLSVSFLQCWGGEEGDRPKIVIFLHLIFLLHLCSFPSSIYTVPPLLHSFPQLHFIFCAAGSRGVSQLLCLRLCNGGNRLKKRSKTKIKMCMREGGGIGRQGYSWSPAWKDQQPAWHKSILNSQQRNTMWTEHFKGRACQLQKPNL